MKTVNSISGGKTSSYMAVHYPADYNVFACVLIDDASCGPKDKGLIKAVSDKLGRDFIATAERDDTLRVVLDLEQLMGHPITWVAGASFDQVIKRKHSVPHMHRRFCTTELKIRPIFDWWHANITNIIEMRIGIRYDEKERADLLTTNFKGITGKRGTLNKWETVTWRTLRVPLVENKINHCHVSEWAKTISLPFPLDSNCVGCFWKPIQQLRKNWEEEPDKMQWFSEKEQQRRGHNRGRKMTMTWKDEISYEAIKSVGIQADFLFGTGAGCQAGYCKD